MLLLSGGIDSPVAGWMMAKRGLELGGVHFFSYPYTSPEARDKVLELIARYQREKNTTVLLVSHSMEDVARYADRVARGGR